MTKVMLVEVRQQAVIKYYRQKPASSHAKALAIMKHPDCCGKNFHMLAYACKVKVLALTYFWPPCGTLKHSIIVIVHFLACIMPCVFEGFKPPVTRCILCISVWTELLLLVFGITMQQLVPDACTQLVMLMYVLLCFLTGIFIRNISKNVHLEVSQYAYSKPHLTLQ